MQRTEPKRPVGIPQSVFLRIEKYAQKNKMFIFQAVCKAWEVFDPQKPELVKKKK